MVIHDDMEKVEAAKAALADAGGLISLNGMGDVWGLTKQAVSNYVREEDFPEPIPTHGTTRLVWIAAEVLAWKVARENLKLSR